MSIYRVTTRPTPLKENTLTCKTTYGVAYSIMLYHRYRYVHTLNYVESNFRLNCNLFMSNFTLLHCLGCGLPGYCPFHIIGQFSLVCIISMTFDLNLVITINLRNKFLRSELYGSVVLEIGVCPVV